MRLVGFACVGSQLWGDVCDDATTFTKVRSLTHLLYTLSVSSFGVFFFLNAYLLQERRHLAPAKDTEAKTRFRR